MVRDTHVKPILGVIQYTAMLLGKVVDCLKFREGTSHHNSRAGTILKWDDEGLKNTLVDVIMPQPPDFWDSRL